MPRKPKKILLKGTGPHLQKEADVAVDIFPGMLAEKDANGEIKPHSSAGGNCVPYIVKEQGYIGNGIDDAYAVGDRATYIIPGKGEEVYAFLAAGENVDPTDVLESAGNGALQAHTPQNVDEGGANTFTINLNAVKFKPVEAVDNSGGVERVRIKVEVI